MENFVGIAHPAAAGGGKGNHRLAGKIIGFQKSMDNGGGQEPPDGEADKDRVILRHIFHTAGNGGEDRLVPLPAAAAVWIGPVQIVLCVGDFRLDFIVTGVELLMVSLRLTIL